MTEIGEAVFGRRQHLSRNFIAGHGIEIGALDAPFPITGDAQVKFVDQFTKADLLVHYPELTPRAAQIIDPDIVDDGETLSQFQPASQDFVIASHFLEHCQNPLGTLRNHFRVLRPGGHLLVAVPNTGHPGSFDHDRDLTTFDHVERDDREGPEWSREHHFWEWVTFAGKMTGERRDYEIKKLMDMNYSIHFHCWTAETFRDFIEKAIAYNKLDGRLVEFAAEEYETIAVLERNP